MNRISAYGGIEMVDLGNRLKTLRLRKGLSQKELARQVGVTKSTISAYEKGDRKPPYENLVLLARIFHVSTDYLLGATRNSGTNLDLSGLTESQIALLSALVNTMR